MSQPLEQHQLEIQENLQSWEHKPLLRELYAGFYQKILGSFNHEIDGIVVEIGSGIGNLKSHFPPALATDLFPNPWLDLVCDGYEMPFADGGLSHLILFDVFHHLEAPMAFLREAGRVLKPRGRLIIFDPYISLASWPAYGLFHHEPVAWGETINLADSLPRPRAYYAAQGNATRLFFRTNEDWPGWRIVRKQAFAAFSYLLSGGFSKPALYPAGCKLLLAKVDAVLSALPRLFGGRCLVVLEKNQETASTTASRPL